MEEEKLPKRHYKIEEGDVITVFRTDMNGFTFYKAGLQKKMYDGTKKYFTKSLAFPKGTDIADKTRIKVLSFFEDVRENKNDKYNPIWSLMITEYEIVENDNTEALNEFNEMMSGDIEITDEDIAF